MVERQEVEALLLDIEEVEALLLDIGLTADEHRCRPADVAFEVEGDTLAALCRAWLAVDEATEVEVREASFSDGHRVGKLIATTDQSMIGQRVRIVKEVEE